MGFLVQTMASNLDIVSETSVQSGGTGEPSEVISNKGDKGENLSAQVHSLGRMYTDTQPTPETVPHDTDAFGLLITSASNSC